MVPRSTPRHDVTGRSDDDQAYDNLAAVSARRISAAGVLIAITLAAAGCGGSSTQGGTTTTSAAPPAPGSAGGGDFAAADALAATLPKSVMGVPLVVTDATGVEIYANAAAPGYRLAQVLAALGVPATDVVAAAAADEGGKIQIISAVFKGTTAAAIQAALIAAAKGTDANVAIAETTIGGKPVTSATYPNSQVGPTSAYVTGDAAYVITSSDPALAEDALKQLP